VKVLALIGLLGLGVALGGCAAALPIAIATEPLWAPAIEGAAKGVVEGLTPKPAATP